MRVKLKQGGVDLPKLLPQLSEIAADWEELVALWLFGSYAAQLQTPLSDLDVAYLLRDGLPEAHVQCVDRELYVALARLLCQLVYDTMPARIVTLERFMREITAYLATLDADEGEG